MPNSLRKFIRREKARIRKEVLDPKEQREQILKLREKTNMSIAGGEPIILRYVYGRQGTINAPSWSPDSQKVAFVSNSD